MKALTIWPEWMWAIANLGKDVENRGYLPPKTIRGQRIALHAGKKVGGKYSLNSGRAVIYYDMMACMARRASILCIWNPRGKDKCGSISFRGGDRKWKKMVFREMPVGMVVATAVISMNSGIFIPGKEAMSPWAAEGQYQWVLEAVNVLKNPVACSGKQGIWNLPEDVEKKVVEQI